MAEDATSNSLGLDFDNLQIKDAAPSDAEPNEPSTEEQPKAAEPAPADGKEKKKPYVNLERVKTGGLPRDKLSEEELIERMARIKEQNEKIKQRRMDVQADEDAFKKTQEADRIRQAQNRKVQEHVNRTREQNAKRKMDKIQTREWDSGKPAGDWKGAKPPVQSADSEVSRSAAEPRGGRGRGMRGSPSNRGRGERGRGGVANTDDGRAEKVFDSTAAGTATDAEIPSNVEEVGAEASPSS